MYVYICICIYIYVYIYIYIFLQDERGGRKSFVNDKGLAHTQRRRKQATNFRKQKRYSRIQRKNIQEYRASCTYTHSNVQSNKQTFTHAYIRSYKSLNRHTYIHMYLHTYMKIFVHILIEY